MKRSIPYILLSLLIFSGCQKKKYPEASEASENIFYAKLLLNGTPVEIDTDKDNYYMYTSYSMDSSNVYNFIGEFKQTNCTNCTKSLRIQINDRKVSSPNSAVQIDSALKVSTYPFLSGMNGIGYSYNFNGAFNKAISSVLWDFGDGSTSALLNPPSHIYQPGHYTVSLTVSSPDGNQSTITNTLAVNQPNGLNTYVTATYSGGVVVFTPHTTGGYAPYHYTWDFGDGSSGTSVSGVGSALSHTYHILGGYNVRIKVTDSQVHSQTVFYNAITSDPSACGANFTFSDPVYVGKRLGAKVSINYTDENGITYTSDNALQPGNSQLEILSVDDFVNNENGQPVKKVKLRFNCVLYHGSQSITLQGLEIIAGFAYK